MSSLFLGIISFVLFVAICVLGFILIGKNEQVDQLMATLNKMRRSFNELDEQAKLIVKTDLQLNRAQEELDRRLKSLDALQKASRLISTTLDENEIFHRLDQSLLTELGFEKNLIMFYDENKNLHSRVNIGFSEKEIEYIITNLSKDTNISTDLTSGHTISSVATTPLLKRDAINRLFNIEHFVLSPILTQSGIIGIIFVGNQSNALPITEGDEELISILANQIGQSLENARLFEQAFRSSQDLESKVQDRTKQLASALEEVKNISKMKSEFISAVSHELRTPLTSIKGYAAILMTGKLGNIPDAVNQRLEKINLHSDNLVKLINDLLDIARIESGRMAMNLNHCHLGTIVENIRDLLTPQMKDKKLSFQSEIDPRLPEMYLDASQIDRVFINLIGNAIKFTPENGLISVKTRFDAENQIVFVDVGDTGIGIAEEDLDKLFNEFYRVDNKINQSVKGTGLGLTLAKKIVEAHGGTMGVSSKLGEGTTFHFTLPMKPDNKPEEKT